MSKSIFQFKQFSIDQTGSAMKINTDGVLLAVKAKANDPKYILDIGAGTGVIALMLAQRFPEAQIHALEINPEAAICATHNFQNSPFSDRLTLYSVDFLEFEPSQSYDLIVSNPPFFINSLKNPDQHKMTARHAHDNFFENLFMKTHDWLNEKGTFQIIWPLSIRDFSRVNGFLSSWRMQNEITIRSFEESEAFRVITTFGKQKSGNSAVELVNCSVNDFVIYKEKGHYTEEYRSILKPFFLNF